jgi:hypothetical protein
MWNERVIATAVGRQTLARKCVVLVDNCNWTGHECDVLAVTTDLRVIDVEVKISRSDLKADARKDKWWHYPSYTWGTPKPQPIAKPWPNKVWKHYYAMPADIWDDSLFDVLPSTKSGVLLMRWQGRDGRYPAAVCRRRATPNKDAYRLKPEEVMDIARLANLRMWDAYEREAKNKITTDLHPDSQPVDLPQ